MRRTSASRFIAGDPLRAVAAVSVLVYHTAYFVAPATSRTPFDPAYGAVAGRVLGSLHLGLFVFFVLSGYLISAPFVRAFVAGQPAPSLGRYVRNRLVRIVPAFWIILTLELLLVGALGASPLQVAAVYGFAQNYTHGPITHLMLQAWTLDVEIAFYALVPVVTLVMTYACRRSSEQTRTRVLLAMLGGGLAASLAARALGPSTYAWQTSLPAMLFAFIPGVALATIEMTDMPIRLRRHASKLPAVVLLVLGLVILGTYATRPPAATTQFVGWSGAALAALGTGAVVASTLIFQWSTARCWRTLDNRIVRWIGKRSYSLYLVHWTIAFVVVHALAVPAVSPVARLALLLPVVLALALVTAAGAFRWFEQPFLRTRKPTRTLPKATLAFAEGR